MHCFGHTFCQKACPQRYMELLQLASAPELSLQATRAAIPPSQLVTEDIHPHRLQPRNLYPWRRYHCLRYIHHQFHKTTVIHGQSTKDISRQEMVGIKPSRVGVSKPANNTGRQWAYFYDTTKQATSGVLTISR